MVMSHEESWCIPINLSILQRLALSEKPLPSDPHEGDCAAARKRMWRKPVAGKTRHGPGKWVPQPVALCSLSLQGTCRPWDLGAHVHAKTYLWCFSTIWENDPPFTMFFTWFETSFCSGSFDSSIPPSFVDETHYRSPAWQAHGLELIWLAWTGFYKTPALTNC